MALLDFIKNRNAQQRQPVAENTQQQKPESAKEMYTRQDAEQKANRIAPTADQEARAQKIGEEMRSAIQSQERSSSVPANAPSDGSTNSAQLQNQSHQAKAQESLSPTDDAAGKTAVQEKQPAPEKAPDRAQQTVARRPPSWER